MADQTRTYAHTDRYFSSRTAQRDGATGTTGATGATGAMRRALHCTDGHISKLKIKRTKFKRDFKRILSSQLYMSYFVSSNRNIAANINIRVLYRLTHFARMLTHYNINYIPHIFKHS